jgi:hypothetical protein
MYPMITNCALRPAEASQGCVAIAGSVECQYASSRSRRSSSAAEKSPAEPIGKRDVDILVEAGFLRTKSAPLAGHGRQTLVEPVARRMMLVAEI